MRYKVYLREGSCRVGNTVVTLVSQLTISISKFLLGNLRYKNTTIADFSIDIITGLSPNRQKKPFSFQLTKEEIHETKNKSEGSTLAFKQ